MTGRVAASNILADFSYPVQRQRFESVPYFWTSQYGKSLRLTGNNKGYDRLQIDGSLDSLEFAAYYFKNDKGETKTKKKKKKQQQQQQQQKKEKKFIKKYQQTKQNKKKTKKKKLLLSHL